MAENNSNGTTETAAPTEPKKPAVIDLLHQEWVKAGSKTVSAKDAKSLAEALKTAHKRHEAAKEAALATQKELTAAWAAVIRARGKGKITIPGMGTFVPMSRADTIYGREEGNGVLFG